MPNASIQYGLQKAIETDLKALATAGTLTGIAAASVVERKVPSARDFGTATGYLAYPGILICPAPSAETLEIRDNARDRWGFPVLITIIAKDDQALTTNEDTYFFWRQKIIETYITDGYSIADPATDFNLCQVEPGPLIDWNRWQQDGVFVTWFILRFFTHKAR